MLCSPYLRSFVIWSIKHLRPLDDTDPAITTSSCPICCEPYDTNKHGPLHLTGVPGCAGHVFGASCLLQWIAGEDDAATCPLCRSKLFTRYYCAVVEIDAPPGEHHRDGRNPLDLNFMVNQLERLEMEIDFNLRMYASISEAILSNLRDENILQEEEDRTEPEDRDGAENEEQELPTAMEGSDGQDQNRTQEAHAVPPDSATMNSLEEPEDAHHTAADAQRADHDHPANPGELWIGPNIPFHEHIHPPRYARGEDSELGLILPSNLSRRHNAARAICTTCNVVTNIGIFVGEMKSGICHPRHIRAILGKQSPAVSQTEGSLPDDEEPSTPTTPSGILPVKTRLGTIVILIMVEIGLAVSWALGTVLMGTGYITEPVAARLAAAAVEDGDVQDPSEETCSNASSDKENEPLDDHVSAQSPSMEG